MTALFPAWADGVNYDRSELSLYTATAGFVLGEGILGTNVLGADGPLLSQLMTITSIVVNEPCGIEDGLFVHREVDSCTVTGTQPLAGPMGWKGKRLQIEYGSKVLYRGTVREASIVESVDTESWKPGNTATRTHRLTLRATTGIEPLALSPTPPRDFDLTETVLERLQSYVGLPNIGLDFPSADDVDSGVMHNLAGDVSDRQRVLLTDEFGKLIETLRDLCRRTNRYLRLERGAGRMDTESISQPASGGTTVASALRFTDDPALVSAPSALYANKTSTGRTVSYAELERGEDASMYCTGATVTLDNATDPVAVVSAFTGGTIDRNDAEINLGNVDYIGRNVQAARNFLATLPLKAQPDLFVRRIVAPLQSEHQVQNRVPGIATLNRDGVDELVAIVGITHTITPNRWRIEYDCAPPHLLTRESDHDPSPPTGLDVTDVGGGALLVEWNAPRSMPQDISLYRTVFRHSNANAGGEVPSDTDHVWYQHELAIGEAPGAPQSLLIVKPAPGSYIFAVQYSSAPASALGTGSFDPSWRLGQPTSVQFTVT